jgi:hypothetical protein
MAIGSVKTAEIFFRMEQLIEELVHTVRYEIATDFDDSEDREEKLLNELEALGESLHQSRLNFDKQRLKEFKDGK